MRKRITAILLKIENFELVFRVSIYSSSKTAFLPIGIVKSPGLIRLILISKAVEQQATERTVLIFLWITLTIYTIRS